MRQGIGIAVALLALSLAGCSSEHSTTSDPDPVDIATNENGSELSLASRQEVVVTLQTIGPGQYGDPTLSSAAVSFEGMEYPQAQNPGGPTQVYRFKAIADGTTQISIPHEIDGVPFTLTLRCCAK